MPANLIVRSLDLETLVLESGAHSPDSTFCVMEAVAYIAGEPWTDAPKCVCPVLAAFLRSWNDGLDKDARQKLKPYIPRVIGTAGDGNADRRGWMCVDWLLRECASSFLDSVPSLAIHATELRALPAIRDSKSFSAAQPILAAAGDAAGDAAGAAAGDAAGAAAGAAAWAAAWAAARDAAGAAAWDAAWDAARDAALRTLAPIVDRVQVSAFALLDRMIEMTEDANV